MFRYSFKPTKRQDKHLHIIHFIYFVTICPMWFELQMNTHLIVVLDCTKKKRLWFVGWKTMVIFYTRVTSVKQTGTII